MHNMKMGYELEFCTTLNGDALKAFFLDRFQITLGGADNTYKSWVLKRDGSINPPRGYSGYEIASAAMPYETAIEKLEKILAAMAETDTFVTNSSTGLHIGLSFSRPTLNSQINPVVLSSSLEETKIKKLFGREKNSYCKNTKSYMKQIVQGQGRYGANLVDIKVVKKKPQIAINAENLRREAMLVGKYSFVNYSKLQQNYLEFRGLGGADYETKFPDIKSSIEHFVDCMHRSLDWNTDSDWFQSLVKKVKKQKLADARNRVTQNERNIKEAEAMIAREQRARETYVRELEQIEALLADI